MDNLAFGLADRRSILASLFMMVLSVFWLGNTFPLDSSSAFTLFTGLVFLTGYLFLARIVVRIAATIVYWMIGSPLGIVPFLKEAPYGGSISFGDFLSMVLWSMKERIWVPLSVRTDWQKRQRYFRSEFRHYQFKGGVRMDEFAEYDSHGMGFLGLLDRVGLVAVSFIVTLAEYQPLVYQISGVGVGLMVLTFVLTGRYSLVVRDSLDHAERLKYLEKHEAELKAKGKEVLP